MNVVLNTFSSYLFICLFVYLFIYLYIYLFIYLFTYLFIYLFILYLKVDKHQIHETLYIKK